MAVLTARRRIVLRPMTADDVTAVRRIERSAYGSQWPATSFEAELRNQLASYLVAVEELVSEEPGITPGIDAPAPLVPPQRRGIAAWARRMLRRMPASDASRIVGFAGAWFMIDQLHITTIAVAPREQHRGIATRLLLDCVTMGQDAELPTVVLEVRPTNERARELYARFGFREIGRRVAYYKDNGEDAIIMQTDDLASEDMRARLDALRADLEARHSSTEWAAHSSPVRPEPVEGRSGPPSRSS